MRIVWYVTAKSRSTTSNCCRDILLLPRNPWIRLRPVSARELSPRSGIAIEQAVQELGGFDTRVQSITSRLTTYDTLVKQYEGPPPQFPIDRDCVANLAVSARTAERLRSDSLQGSMQLRIRNNL